MDQKKNAELYDFAMIGHPGAGKTVLAAGLYVAVGEDFVTIPEHGMTQSYVGNACTVLEKGEYWPEPTQGEKIELYYTLLHKNKHYRLRFNDHPGERIADDDFMREVVKTPEGNYPDGVLLLVNCVAKQFDDPVKKIKMRTDCQKFIEDLASRHVPVALVVTAWDRMSTDRKDSLEEFETFLKGITEILEGEKCTWKRFNVSVTGELVDQDHPRLKPNNVEAPFIWLLNQQPEAKLRRRLKAILLALLAVLLLAGGVYLSWPKTKKVDNQKSKDDGPTTGEIKRLEEKLEKIK